MTSIVAVVPLENYILHVTTDDGHVLDFDVMKELKRIPAYKRLYNKTFFNQVHFKSERIYWDFEHDFHIDQVLARARWVK